MPGVFDQPVCCFTAQCASAASLFTNREGLIFIVVFGFKRHVEVLVASDAVRFYARVLSVRARSVAWYLPQLALGIQGILAVGVIESPVAASLVYLDNP